MTAYTQLIKSFLKVQANYKKALLTSIILQIINLLIYFLLFKCLYEYSHAKSIVGYDLTRMVWYFGGLTLSWALIWNYAEWNLSDRIIDGSLAIDLLRPISLFKIEFSKAIAALILCIMFEFLLTLIIQSLVIFPYFLTILSLCKYLISILLSFVMFFIINFIIGLSGFFTTNIRAMFNLKFMLLAIFGGSYIPLEFLPHWLNQVIKFLPFQYIAYWPIQLLLNRTQYQSTNTFLHIIGMQLFWIIFFYISYRILWSISLKKLTLAGG